MGCNASERDTFDSGSLPTGAALDDDGGGDDGAADEGADTYDVGMGQGSAEGGDGQPGCDKVDFLFVIDNSGSMVEEQTNLISSFPQFIQTIETTLDDAQDYHVMVTDTDPWVFQSCELLQCGGIPLPLCGPSYQCGVTQPLECEDVLGGSVVHPRGPDASNRDCNFASGERFIDSMTEPDVSVAFECAARVGTGSTADPERPMEALVQAVTPNTPAAGCNQGFLRDDAILVVTFITDEDDGNGDSAGTAAGWKEALVAAKNGDESAIVVLGLFGDNDQAGGICLPYDSGGAEPAPRLTQFVDSFGDHGVRGTVCAPSYQEFFQSAVSIIDTTCDEFVPPQG